MNIKYAVFDFDGTLFDSMFIWQVLAKKYLKSKGKVPKASLMQSINRLNLPDAAKFIKNQYLPDLSEDEILKEINNTAEELYLSSAKPKCGICDFLKKLKHCGFKMSVATASDKKVIETVLKKWDMENYFEKIFTCGDIGFGKDKPDIYLEAAEYFGSKPQNTIIFEDALFAATTAANEGFLTVGVFDESEKNQKKLKNLCDFYIKDFKNFESFKLFVLSKEKIL